MSITFEGAHLIHDEEGDLLTPAPDGPEGLNVHNGNAAVLFDLLGLPFDGDFGGVPGADMLGRVLIAQGLLDVATDDEHGRPAVIDGRWIEGKRLAGALDDHLYTLFRLSSWAIDHEAWVMWG